MILIDPDFQKAVWQCVTRALKMFIFLTQHPHFWEPKDILQMVDTETVVTLNVYDIMMINKFRRTDQEIDWR